VVRRRSLSILAALGFALTLGLSQAAAYAKPVWIYSQLAPGTPARVFNAYGCGNPANVVWWPYAASGGCPDGASNEQWTIVNLGTYGADEIEAFEAHYGGNTMCLNVRGASYTEGTQIIAYNCNGGIAANEKFIVLTNPAQPGYDLTPWGGNTSQECLNVWGGFGDGNPIKLYPCGVNYSNEVFSTTSSL
jgi:hypothetical protein